MEDYTIKGTYTLPSLAKVYSKEFNPEVTIRSMTTNEEMKRLNYSDKGYSVMAEIIDDCIVDDLPVSAYDMCVADYQFLLHRLRVVTYGNIYKMNSVCPYCGTTTTSSIDLESLVVKPFNEEEIKKYIEFDLPQTGKHIKLRMQTPRLLDGVNARAKEQKKKTPDLVGDPAFLFTLESLIAEIDGERPDPVKLSSFVRSLPMMDTNYILKHSQKLLGTFGIEPNVTLECKGCGLEYVAPFRVTSEFFGPSIDI